MYSSIEMFNFDGIHHFSSKCPYHKCYNIKQLEHRWASAVYSDQDPLCKFDVVLSPSIFGGIPRLAGR
jgi:hypothetical protein